MFFIRRFDDCNKYAIDLNVRAILELSKRKCFENMNFNIYGTGDTYDKLIEPLLKFKNVHFYREFLTHEEIAKKHKENGIAFFQQDMMHKVFRCAKQQCQGLQLLHQIMMQ